MATLIATRCSSLSNTGEPLSLGYKVKVVVYNHVECAISMPSKAVELKTLVPVANIVSFVLREDITGEIVVCVFITARSSVG